MKKNNFLSGLSAKLALAIVALTTTMFTSCEKENIEIGITPVPAKATIIPVVFANGSDVTSAATITTSTGTISDGKITLEGTTIAAQEITVTATYNSMTNSATVKVPALTSAQVYATSVNITLNYSSDDFSAPQQVGDSETTAITSSQEQIYDNPTDYWLNVPVKYNQVSGKTVLNADYNIQNEALTELVNSYNTGYKSKSVTEDTFVGAHSRLTVSVKTKTTRTTYTVSTKTRAAENVLVTFVVEEITTFLESDGNQNIPGHSHSHAGHGHGHGDDNNAGGGIIFAD